MIVGKINIIAERLNITTTEKEEENAPCVVDLDGSADFPEQQNEHSQAQCQPTMGSVPCKSRLSLLGTNARVPQHACFYDSRPQTAWTQRASWLTVACPEHQSTTRSHTDLVNEGYKHDSLPFGFLAVEVGAEVTWIKVENG